MNVGKYIIRNKKRSIFTIIGITISTSLLILTCLIVSSFRKYLIDNVKTNVGDYHVIIMGDIKEKDIILKKEYKDDRYYITYKDIYKVYQNTEKICKKCETITYNDSLLSLYGLSKNKNVSDVFKTIIYFFTVIFSVMTFFIIYSSYKVSLRSRREDLCRFKLIGFTNYDIYKLFIKESIILSIVGILTGFIISLIIGWVIISLMGSMLYEIFAGKLHLSLHIPFLIIPIMFIILIISVSTLMPLKRVRKYKPMELFRKSKNIEKIKIPKIENFILWFSITNYIRSKGKYKSLIISIFISTLSVNIFFTCLNYTLKCIDEFVIIPKYDLYVNVEDNYDLNKISKDLKGKKSIIFSSCRGKIKISSGEEMSTVITDIGGNNVVNIVDKIESNGMIKHIKKKRFKDLNEVLFTSDKQVLIGNLSLTDEVPFGMENVEDVIINLDQDRFNDVCSYFTKTLILKTDYKGIDNYLNDIIKKEKVNMSYLNIKKAKGLTENLILMIKLFLYLITFLIILIMISLTVNITSINTVYRKSELASLNSIGLERRKINFSIFIESLIISFKGWFYSVPFVFLASKIIYTAVKKLFDYKGLLIPYNILFLSLFASFIIIYLSMIACYKMNKKNVIDDIKNND